jgi:hypothetical protein
MEKSRTASLLHPQCHPLQANQGADSRQTGIRSFKRQEGSIGQVVRPGPGDTCVVAESSGHLRCHEATAEGGFDCGGVQGGSFGLTVRVHLRENQIICIMSSRRNHCLCDGIVICCRHLPAADINPVIDA